MSIRRNADLVFCLDVSTSMGPCIEGLKQQIVNFTERFSDSNQVQWDLRLGILAHCATRKTEDSGVVVLTQTLVAKEGLAAIYTGDAALFTRDVGRFKATLENLELKGDEAMLFALDCALDFPWRDSTDSHRVVVMMTDEPIEDGLMLEVSKAVLEDLIRKIMNQHIMLFILGPDSAILEHLSMVDRSEWELVEGYAGLRDVNFRKVLESIARSISVSAIDQQQSPLAIPKQALFGQDKWKPVKGITFYGR
jgi:hypothetical protein